MGGAARRSGKAEASARKLSPAASASPGWLVWLPAVLVLGGALLRVVYTAGSDVRNVHDDHFHVARVILEEKRWPRPAEGWQTYQPPLYYVLSALTYYVASGEARVPPPPQPTPEQQASAAGIPCPYPRHATGRKAIQFLSTISGIGTLVLVWLTLRCLFPASPGAQSVGVALAAFLPRHIYMSGMASNDALTYLWAALCLYAVLRALRQLTGPPTATVTQRRPGTHPGRQERNKARYGWWITAGVAGALTMWTKQYGLGSLGVLAAAIPAGVLVKSPAARRIGFTGAMLALALALLLGVWPYVRTWRLTGDPLASNYTLRPHNMDQQLPGDVAQVSFLSLRLPSLLARPWVHISTVNSYWSAIFGELWFDYGTSTTIYQYRPWLMHVWPIWRDQTISGRERERRGLIWDTSVVSANMLRQGRLLIALGVIPTGLMVAGFFAIWRRTAAGASLVLAAVLAMGLATPLFQTLRQPFRSSMKATFMLCALPALAALAAVGWQWLTQRRYGRWLGMLVIVDLVLLAGVAAWHFVDLALVFPGSAEYFARRDPL